MSSQAESSSPVDESSRIAYNTCAVAIFATMSITFLFPCNKIIPLDRRTVAVFCATLCYVTRRFAFRDSSHSLVEDVEFDVLILLASIMAINHIVVHLKETNRVVRYIQNVIRESPLKGYWIVSFAAFIISPFLTNDGVCLLFVEPILSAFEHLFDVDSSDVPPRAGTVTDDVENQSLLQAGVVADADNKATAHPAGAGQLDKRDAIYFLLSLACSSNFGSALTYTGNPQNMIVSTSSLGVLPPYLFLGIMLLPTLLGWLATTLWIQYCWQCAKEAALEEHAQLPNEESNHDVTKDYASATLGNSAAVELLESKTGDESDHLKVAKSTKSSRSIGEAKNPILQQLEVSTSISSKASCGGLRLVIPEALSPSSKSPRSPGVSSPLSPRRRQAKKREEMINRVVHVVSSPFPYMMIVLLIAMIVMIFVDVISISSLICITAIVMIVSLVMGNHIRGRPIWFALPVDRDTSDHAKKNAEPISDEDKVDNINQFFEELFNSIDYSLLLIFLGTFIVVANIDSTGIPRIIWNKIVGDVPFNTFGSIVGISMFVLLASQLLGNVAVIQLAKPNIEFLGDAEKKMAWAIISFVATIGGNLTITGSAANIIVAEKSARIDPDSSLDFFSHFRVCFWITFGCCCFGGAMIAGLVSIDNALNA